MPRQAQTELAKIEDLLMKNHKDVSRRDVVAIFRTMEEFGAGEFIPGRRGHPSRFRWDVDSINLIALEQPKPLPPSVPAPMQESKPIDFLTPTVLINHRYQLRADLIISIQLPSDIITSEARRLNLFISSLPFNMENSVQNNSIT